MRLGGKVTLRELPVVLKFMVKGKRDPVSLRPGHRFDTCHFEDGEETREVKLEMIKKSLSKLMRLQQ